MQEVKMTCTTCPGCCTVTALLDDDGNVTKIWGNGCPKGREFALKECTDPVRTLTSTVYAKIGEKEVLIPVKTQEPLPQRLVFEAMEQIQEVRLNEPVTMGDVLLSDVAGSGIPLVACKTVH